MKISVEGRTVELSDEQAKAIFEGYARRNPKAVKEIADRIRIEEEMRRRAKEMEPSIWVAEADPTRPGPYFANA